MLLSLLDKKFFAVVETFCFGKMHFIILVSAKLTFFYRLQHLIMCLQCSKAYLTLSFEHNTFTKLDFSFLC